MLRNYAPLNSSVANPEAVSASRRKAMPQRVELKLTRRP